MKDFTTPLNQRSSQMNSCFYVVWNEKHGPPTFKHMTEEEARKEAERLTVTNPGNTFHVLMVVATCGPKEGVSWIKYTKSKIPSHLK